MSEQSFYMSEQHLLVSERRAGAWGRGTNTRGDSGSTGKVNFLQPGLNLRSVGGGDLVDCRVVGDDNGRLSLDNRQGQDDDSEGGGNEVDHVEGLVVDGYFFGGFVKREEGTRKTLSVLFKLVRWEWEGDGEGWRWEGGSRTEKVVRKEGKTGGKEENKRGNERCQVFITLRRRMPFVGRTNDGGCCWREK